MAKARGEVPTGDVRASCPTEQRVFTEGKEGLVSLMLKGPTGSVLS